MTPEWKRLQSAGRAEWAERYGVRESKGGRCLYWLERGRCGRYCRIPGRWYDHAAGWLDEGGRAAVITLQPYGWPSGYLDLSHALQAHPGLFLRMEQPRNGWHHPSTSLIEIWRNEDAYLAAIGRK